MSGQIYSVPFAQIPEWVVDADVSDRAIRVFLVLQRHANDKGHAFPGRAKLAERVKCSPASVDRALNELRGVGAIQSRHRTANGGVIGNDYWLWPAEPPPLPSSPVNRGGLTGDATPRRVGDATLASPVTQQKEREPVNESHLNESHLPVAATRDESSPPTAVYPADFEAFWKPYPRKDDKAAAFKVWPKAVKAAAAETIAAAAARYAADPNRLPEYTKLAATWLNKRSWENGPLPARSRGRVSTLIEGNARETAEWLNEKAGQANGTHGHSVDPQPVRAALQPGDHPPTH